MLRKISRSKLLTLFVISVLISTTTSTRCYRCIESGLIRDVHNCGKTVECRYGCKITQVLSQSEVVVEQDCFELTPFPYNANNNDNVNPTYTPGSQYPSRQLPPVIFSPHNPDNREYSSGWDNTGTNYNNNNNNNHNSAGLNGCSTYSAVLRFRSLFPYVSGYSATCNTCDWDYCNGYNSGNGVKVSMASFIAVTIAILFKSLW